MNGCIDSPKSASDLVADELKTGHVVPIHFDCLQEHLFGTHPKSSFAIILPVHDQFFLGFVVASNSDDDVIVAFVVAVT
jgi:hypothetical protein